MANNLTQLRQQLNRYFNIGELKTICFDLGIDHESLETSTKSRLVETLIAHLARTGGMPALLAMVREQRQHVTWPDISEAELETAVAETSQPQVVNQFHGTTYLHQGTGDQQIGDRFDMSGDFRGAILNIKSTLENVSQSVNALPNASDSDKDELTQLLAQLNESLGKVSPEQAEAADAVAQAAKMHVETADVEKPNKTMVQITGEGLKQAAENIKDALPAVLIIATKIVATIGRIVGMAG